MQNFRSGFSFLILGKTNVSVRTACIAAIRELYQEHKEVRLIIMNSTTDLHSTGQLEDFFFRNLLPEDNSTEEYLDACLLYPLANGNIEEKLLFLRDLFGKDNTTQDNVPTDGRGKGFWNKRKQQDPDQLIFFLRYIQDADKTAILRDKNGTIWNAKSSDGKTFCCRFGLPYNSFDLINKDWSSHGEFRATRDAVGQTRTNSRASFLVLFECLQKVSPLMPLRS